MEPGNDSLTSSGNKELKEVGELPSVLEPGTDSISCSGNEELGEFPSEMEEERAIIFMIPPAMDPENKSCHSRGNKEFGLLRTKRELPPLHYSIRIKEFSLLAEKHEKYESFNFESGGYKWKLWIHPKGNTNNPNYGKDFVAISLAIQDTDSLRDGWEVNVDVKLFVFDHVENKFLVVQDGQIRRFHDMKIVWDFDDFLSQETFNNPCNGFLVNDGCLIGAEVFVIKPSGIDECIQTVQSPKNGSLTWKIPKFSKLGGGAIYSEPFLSENRKWRIRVDPKGSSSGKENSLSVYIHLMEVNKIGAQERVWVNCELRVLNKDEGQHVKAAVSQWYAKNQKLDMIGRHQFLPLKDLHDCCKGFLVDDTLTVEAEILFLTVAKVIS